MVRAVFIASLRHNVEDAINSEKCLAAPAKHRIGVKYLSGIILVEHAVARKVLDPGVAVLKIVVCVPGGKLRGRERNIEVVVEVAAIGRNPSKAPPHPLADRLDF